MGEERPSEVEPGLWVCSEAAVASALADPSLGITHLISIGYPPPGHPEGDDDDDDDGSAGGSNARGVKTLSVELEDDEDGDLLTQIPACVAFIQDALRLRDANRAAAAAAVNDDDAEAAASSSAASTRRGGGALVHCHAGVSRSCAVIAAHVMKTRGVDADDALEVVRRAHPRADPNAGFVAQLRLWRSMDCKLNMADEAYRLYSVARLARRREYRGYVDATDVQPDPGAEGNDTAGDDTAGGVKVDRFVPFSGSATSLAIVGPRLGGGPEAGTMIRCRRCGRLVARGGNLLPHRPGQGIDAFSWRKRHKMEAAGAGSGSGSAGGGQEPFPQATPASEDDWSTEYLDSIISVRVVDGLKMAVTHIATYGSSHTDCIITENAGTAETFLREVDSAIVMVNASTQFADGGEFGMGAEIGIATGRMHARGPVGAAQLTSFKYLVRGNGQLRDG